MIIRLRRFAVITILLIPCSLFSQPDSLRQAPPDSSRLSPNLPWTIRSLNQSTIAGIPSRGIEQYLPLLPGMVEVNDGLYVRGSRNGETGYLLDGMSVFNPWLNSNGVPLIPEAIDGIDAHTGSYGAELGSFGGGIVNTRMKTGGEKLEYSFNIQTDDLGSPGSSFGIGNFKAVNYGYRNIVGTIGGPLPYTPIRFFLAGQSNFMRSRQPMFLTPFRYDNLVTDNFGARPAGQALPGPIEFRENYIGTSWINTTTLQGNATLNLFGIDLKLIGSYDDREFTEGSQWPDMLRNYYRQKRDMLTRHVTKYLNLQAHYAPTASVDLSVGLSYYNRFARTYDPDFKNNWRLYTDSLANASLGYAGFVSRYQGPNPYSTIFEFNFYDPLTPNGTYNTGYYSKESQNSFALEASMKWKATEAWTVSAGGRLETWTLRSWNITNTANLNSYMDTDQNGRWDRTFNSPLERKVYMMRQGGITAMGYQYDDPSKIVDDGPEHPGKPDRASAYVQAAYASNDLRMEVGGRYERFDPKFTSVPHTLNPITGLDDPPVDYNLGILKEDELVPSAPADYLLPRLALWVPVTQDISFRAAYGHYVQMNSLDKLYISNMMLTAVVSPGYRVPYNLGGTPATFTARPERSIQYELGFSGSFPRGRWNVAFFQKTMTNQLQLGFAYSLTGEPLYVDLVNDGKATSRGVEATLDLPLSRVVRFIAAYSYSETEGRFSDALSDYRYVSPSPPREPTMLHPLNYDQPQKGTLLGSLNFSEQDGPVLDGFGIDLVFTAHSGNRYTSMPVPTTYGSVSPWEFGVQEFVFPWASSPLEPENASQAPWYYNVDLQIRKRFAVYEALQAEISLSILNLFNRRNIQNVYPTTGSPNDDGWLGNPRSAYYDAYPGYADFYRTINLENRWAYMRRTGNDIYGIPRQIRVGLKVEM